MKNIYRAAGLVASLALISTPLIASAQSNADLTSQVQSLVSQITSLEQQLKSLLQANAASSTSMWNQDNGTSTTPWNPGNATSTPPGMGAGMGAPCPVITRNLSIGSSGSDVSSLQQMLSSMGFLSASSTGFFGQLTAHALAQFQNQNGISTSSSGFFGQLTRNFLNVHCGDRQGNGPGNMGSSTPGMPPHLPWQNGSSTPPCGIPSMPETANSGSAAPDFIFIRPCGGMGSSTQGMPVLQPCNQNLQPGDATGTLYQAAAVAAALFVPHTLIPGMQSPCHGVPMTPPEQGSGQNSNAPMIPASSQ